MIFFRDFSAALASSLRYSAYAPWRSCLRHSAERNDRAWGILLQSVISSVVEKSLGVLS